MKTKTLLLIERVRLLKKSQTAQMVKDVIHNRPIEFDKDDAEIVIGSYLESVKRTKAMWNMIDDEDQSELGHSTFDNVDYMLSNLVMNANFAYGLI